MLRFHQRRGGLFANLAYTYALKVEINDDSYYRFHHDGDPDHHGRRPLP